jgi:hypothetical protein
MASMLAVSWKLCSCVHIVTVELAPGEACMIGLLHRQVHRQVSSAVDWRKACSSGWVVLAAQARASIVGCICPQ